MYLFQAEAEVDDIPARVGRDSNSTREGKQCFIVIHLVISAYTESQVMCTKSISLTSNKNTPA